MSQPLSGLSSMGVEGGSSQVRGAAELGPSVRVGPGMGTIDMGDEGSTTDNLMEAVDTQL